MEENQILEERKKKVVQFLKKEYVYISITLILLILLGVYIRSLPMQTNSQTGKPGLWDFAKNEWTLGPDLDPWLFTRYAKTMITTGHLPHIDEMRNAPLGFDTTTELQMVSYMIVWTYKIINPFYKTNLEFYAALMPVLFFILTILAFFFFVREVFVRKDERRLKANIIASLSTLFMIIIPVFISRTVAGIPEKESVGFFFMFLAFFLYLKSWKLENSTKSYIIAGLAGLATALMGLTWGGVIYIYITIALSTLIAFVLGKVNKKEIISYSIWLIVSLIVTLIFTNRFSISGFISSLDTGVSVLVLFILIIDFILWKTKIKDKLDKIEFLKKVPSHIISIIAAGIIGFFGILILFGPSVILDKWDAINQLMFKPVVGRWNTTVAENRQPYFWEWASSFGPFIGKFPVLFWLFLIGVSVFFWKIIKGINKKDKLVLEFLFVFMLCGMIFSRYSYESLFNGENFISKIFYYLSVIAFIGFGIYYYLKYEKSENNPLSNIAFEEIFILALFVLCIFTARGAVRLIMTLGPISPIFASYLCVSLGFDFFKSKEELSKTILGIIAGIVVLLVLYSIIGVPFNTSKYPGFYQQAKYAALGMVPSYYNIQWQNAMKWVDKNTSSDSVFAHWWDYGYWVQSIGNRATVTDGGNAITYWNYLSGRYVLTGDNQKDALDFLYSHNATHLLIDSSDLGKYGAFSQIGSDINFDRLSSGPIAFLSNSRLIQEKKNSTLKSYQIPKGDNMIGIAPLEEDIYLNQTNILKDNSGVIGISLEFSENNSSINYKNAVISFVEIKSQKRFDVPLRYVYYKGVLTDFGQGLEAAAFVIPSISGNSVDKTGSVIYISPRLLRGMLSQVYLLDNSLGNFPNLELVKSEPNIIIESINNQNPLLELGEFVYYNGIQGPIKIWKINYSGDEEIREEFLDKDYRKYISWQL